MRRVFTWLIWCRRFSLKLTCADFLTRVLRFVLLGEGRKRRGGGGFIYVWRRAGRGVVEEAYIY